MPLTLIGEFVTHSKLSELGVGEVMSTEKGALRIRFAAGERNFVAALVQPFLSVTSERPPAPVAKVKARAPRKAKPKAAPSAP